MRIAMLGQKIIPSNEGGIEKVVEELSVRMAEKGNRVTCYNRNMKNASGYLSSSKKEKIYRNVRIKQVFTINAKGAAAVSSGFFASICASMGRYDIVHVHAEGPALFCWIPRMFGKKVVVTIHGLDHKREKWGKFSSGVILKGEKNAVKYANKLIVLSRETQNYFKETYNRDTIFLPNGVGEKHFHEAEKIGSEFGLKKDDYILFLGRIVPEKGLRYLIDAFKGVKTEKKLVIAGGSSDTKQFFDDMKELAKEDDRIIFTDYVYGQIKDELYSNAYLYVLPSDLEGMPLSLLEALSYNNCCLTADIPECADVLDDMGLTFKKSDEEDLQCVLQKLVDDPNLVLEYKERTKQMLASKLTWDDVCEKTLDIYRELIK